jgi:LysR family hydrogen peroxide-inducible transcriptional activator
MASFTQLEYVLAVDRLKNFSRAAKECNVSQPSLSAQIQKVEDQLGIVIFDRSKKPVLTTLKGAEVIAQAKIVLREYQKILDVKNDDGVLKGKFHLGVIPSLSSYILPLFIESFSKKYSEVELIISEYKTEDIVKGLYDDNLDAGLLVTPLYDNKLVERTLFYERFLAFTSKNHPLNLKKILTEKDMDPESIWLLEEGHCFRNQVIKICSLDKKNNVLENVKFASGNLETLINLIRKGAGYTLLPELATLNLHQSEIKNNLKSFKNPVPTREVSLVHSRSFLKQDIIEALEENIISNLPLNIKSLKRRNVEIVNI